MNQGLGIGCDHQWGDYATQLKKKWGFPGGSADKESVCNAGDTGDVDSIPGLGRSPGEGNSNPLQYSCLKNPMDCGAWWPTVQSVKKNQT